MTPTPPTLLDDLRHIDPASRGPLSAAQVARRDTEFERIVLIEHPLHNRSRSRRRLVVGLASVAAFALVAGIVVSALPGLTQAPVSSYALPAHGSLSSWTAASAPVTPSSDEVQACAAELNFAGGSPVALTSDQRGDFTSLFVEDGASDGLCVLAEGQVVNSINFEGLEAHPLTDPDAAVISVMQGGDWMYVVSGHAGADVTALTVTNPETGQKVSAAVAKGVWSAWWPVGAESAAWKHGSAGAAYTDAITIDYQTVNGETHTSSGLSGSDDSLGGVPAPAPVALGTLNGWSAATTAFTPAASEVDACAAAGDGWPSGSASTVIAETRGDFHSLLIQRDSDEIYCVVKNGVVQWSREGGVVQLDPVAPGVAALSQGNGFDGVGGSTRISELDGVVGVGVTSVTVHLAAGNDVQAVVQNGRWMAWWPEDAPPALGGPTPTPTDGAAAASAPAGPPPFSWTTSDGLTHDAP